MSLGCIVLLNFIDVKWLVLVIIAHYNLIYECILSFITKVYSGIISCT